MTAMTNAQRQAKYRALRKHAAPTVYDHSLDEVRPITQADVDTLLHRLQEAVDFRHAVLRAMGLPLNAHQQIERVRELGGIYALSRLSADG
jgi:hypothetical protein